MTKTPSAPALPTPKAHAAHGAARWAVRVEPGGWRFETTAGQTLLVAAEAAGLHLPASCRNGTCRTCMCRLLEGGIAYHIEWPGLSAEEKAEGWILPCVAFAGRDVVLRQPAARLAGHMA